MDRNTVILLVVLGVVVVGGGALYYEMQQTQAARTTQDVTNSQDTGTPMADHTASDWTAIIGAVSTGATGIINAARGSDSAPSRAPTRT